MCTNYRKFIVALVVPIVVAVGRSQSHAQPHRHRLDPAPKELRLSAESVSLPMERYLGWAVVEIQGKPASELYGTTSWDKLLEGEEFGIQFRPAGTTDTRHITASIWELVP